jgi:hypothetical protein
MRTRLKDIVKWLSGHRFAAMTELGDAKVAFSHRVVDRLFTSSSHGSQKHLS